MSRLASGDIWLLLALVGALTFLIRLSFIAAQGHYRAPAWFVRLMPLIPIATLVALVVPDVLTLPDTGGMEGVDGARAGAALVAVLVAARWRNTLLTLACGFAALLLLRLV